MDLTKPPRNGEVIHYSYLWRDEKRRGLEEGRKPRPSAVILSKKDTVSDVCRVLVLPITHTQPVDLGIAIEISDQEKRLIGLDNESQWIVCNEVNQFIWPGFDVRPRVGESHIYGMLPRNLYERAKQLFLKLHALGRSRSIDRD